MSSTTSVTTTAPTPTLDANQLEQINQQKNDYEKTYQEQLTELQRLKSLARADKDKFSEDLPQKVNDPELNDLLAKRQEAKQKWVTLDQ